MKKILRSIKSIFPQAHRSINAISANSKFSSVSSSANSITINGKVFKGNNVSMRNGVVIIDGVEQGEDFSKEQIINVEIHGNVDELSTGSGNVTTLSAKSVKTGSGNISVSGSIEGDASTVSGDIDSDIIKGNASSMSGNIKARTIEGDTSSISGDVKSR